MWIQRVNTSNLRLTRPPLQRQHAQWAPLSLAESWKPRKSVCGQRAHRSSCTVFTWGPLSRPFLGLPLRLSQDSDLPFPYSSGGTEGPNKDGVGGLTVEFRSLNSMQPTGSVLNTAPNNRVDQIFSDVWRFTVPQTSEGCHQTFASFLFSEVILSILVPR